MDFACCGNSGKERESKHQSKDHVAPRAESRLPSAPEELPPPLPSETKALADAASSDTKSPSTGQDINLDMLAVQFANHSSKESYTDDAASTNRLLREIDKKIDLVLKGILAQSSNHSTESSDPRRNLSGPISRPPSVYCSSFCTSRVDSSSPASVTFTEDAFCNERSEATTASCASVSQPPTPPLSLPPKRSSVRKMRFTLRSTNRSSGSYEGLHTLKAGASRSTLGETDGSRYDASTHLSDFAVEVLGGQQSQGRGGQQGTRDRLHQFFEDAECSTRARTFHVVMPLLILISILVVFCQSIDQSLDGILRAIDLGFNTAFLAEAVMRLAVYPNFSSQFFSNFSAPKLFLLFDVAAVLPLGLSLYIYNLEDSFPRCGGVEGGRTGSCFVLLCMVPQLRLLKMLRYIEGGFHLISHAFYLLSEALPPMLFLLVVMMWFFASLLFFFEPPSNLTSLSHSMWLAIVTMSTVGYGDVSPESTEGYLVCCGLVVSSVLYMAMPLGIIGNIFTSVWKDRDRIILMKKTQTRLAQAGYSAMDIPALFTRFDSDGIGELDIFKFTAMLKVMSIGLSDTRIDELFQNFDKSRTGVIDAADFIRHLFPTAFHDMYGGLEPEDHETSAVDQAARERSITPIGSLRRRFRTVDTLAKTRVEKRMSQMSKISKQRRAGSERKVVVFAEQASV